MKQIAIMKAPDYPLTASQVSATSQIVKAPSRELPSLRNAHNDHDVQVRVVRNAKTAEKRHEAEMELIRIAERLERTRRGADPIPAEVQVLKLGDTALIAIPGEPFAEMGLAIKEKTIAPNALCLGYCNDSLGYIAPPKVWQQGGYEVALGTWSNVGPEAYQLLLDTAYSLTEKLFPETPTPNDKKAISHKD
jgi:neutral ceramidase